MQTAVVDFYGVGAILQFIVATVCYYRQARGWDRKTLGKPPALGYYYALYGIVGLFGLFSGRHSLV